MRYVLTSVGQTGVGQTGTGTTPRYGVILMQGGKGILALPHIMAIVGDLERCYGKLSVYVIGTSRSTESTLALAGPLDGKVAGFVHTSSVNAIAGLDPRRFRSRHLLVAHVHDACRVTKPAAAEASHRSYGTELILVEVGKTVGDDCEPWAYHGYNGIEKETVDRIKSWIAAGK